MLKEEEEEEEMEEASPPPAPELSPEEEMLLIRDATIAAESQSKEGDAFYLISQRWWQQWLDYVSQDMTCINNNGYGSHNYESACSTIPTRPSDIDNSDLIEDVKSEVSNMEIELHDTLVEGRDYILLPQEVWDKLHGWYGGGPTLSRKAINSGLSQTDLAIEVYPLRLQLLLRPKGERAIVRISKKETVGELHRKASEVFDLILDQVYIWDYYGHQKHTLMNDMDKTLDDANIQMDQDILVEVHNDENCTLDGGWTNSVLENGSRENNSTLMLEPGQLSISVPEGLSTSKNVSRNCASEFSQSQYVASPGSDFDNLHATHNIGTRGVSVGLTGLQNLGNTCFMNSSIQCLVHTPEFARYFREDYRKEINWQNPLGMVGELALAFGELLRKLWAPGRAPVSPKPFKTKLSRFAPQFSGYNQHDSQELLAFLLDGLHEDLNRVKHKPYIKTKDADGRPDEEVADEYWANHIARNDSIIVDVCQGQYKSTLVCPVCGKVSVTFDPFMYLSLPLQSASARTMTIVVFSSDGSALPTPFTVSVPKQGRCKDLIQSLSTTCSLKNGERLLLAEIRGHMIHQFLEDPLLLLSTIKDDDRLAAYRVPKPTKGTTLLQFVHRREEVISGNISSTKVWKPHGVPLVAPVLHDVFVKSSDIERIVHTLLSPMLRSKELLPSDLSHTLSPAPEAHQNTGTNKACKDSSEDDIKTKESETLRPAIPTLALHLADDDDDECINLSTDEMSLNLSSSSVVFINWSQKDLKKYDTHYLENLPEVFKYAPAPKRARGTPLSLYACLDAFLREEPLVPEDMWLCPRCKEQRQASKKLDLWRLPEVLVIHLKRFSFSRSTKHKLETFVNFPIHELDLTNYVAHKRGPDRQLYELYALCNHYGSMASGHYTAHIKVEKFHIRELELSFTQGRWNYESWGGSDPMSSINAKPPGVELLALFDLPSSEIDVTWKNLSHALSGLFCSSINFLESSTAYSAPCWGFPSNSSRLRYGALPREAVCTENLTPWLKLLPCRDKAGLASLLDRPSIYRGYYHSQRLQLISTKSTGIVLKQTLTVVLQPSHGRSSRFSSSEGSLQPSWSISSVFRKQVTGQCILAKASRIFFELDRGLTAALRKLGSGDSSSNQFFEFLSTPSRVIEESHALLGQSTSTLYEFGVANSNEYEPMDVGIMWKLPLTWSCSQAPFHANRFLMGSGNERGSVAISLQSSQSSASYLDQISECTVPVVIFQVVPWYVKVYYHTLQIFIDGKPQIVSDVVEKIRASPSEDKVSPGTLEMMLRFPCSMQSASLVLDFDKGFLHIDEYPPDANQGFDIPSALISFPNFLSNRNYLVDDSLSQSPLLLEFQENNLVKSYTEVLLVPLTTPDFSMPYNVITFTCTVLALYFGSLLNVLRRRVGEEERLLKCQAEKRALIPLLLSKISSKLKGQTQEPSQSSPPSPSTERHKLVLKVILVAAAAIACHFLLNDT